MQLTVNIQQWAGHGNEPTALVVDAGNIVVGADTNGSASSSLVSTVVDGESVIITVNQNGYYPYFIEITNVYDEDKSIDILLVDDITDTLDPEYLMPHAYFFTFVDKCKFKSVHYLASSFPGNYKWLVNNECAGIQSSRFVHCTNNPGEYQVKMVSETERPVQITPCEVVMQPAWYRAWANGGASAVNETGNTVIGQDLDQTDIDGYLAADTVTNVTQLEYRPNFEIQALPAQNTQTNRDPMCYSQGENVDVLVDLSYTRADASPANHSLQWTVRDPFNTVVYTETIPGDAASLNINFDLLSIGTYTVTAVLTDIECCETTYTRELKIETCDFFYVESTECGKFNLVNVSSKYDVDYRVEFIDGTLLTSGTLEAPEPGGVLGVGVEYTTSELGIHTVIIEWLDDEDAVQVRTYVVNNFCSLWDCLAGYINNLLCSPKDICSPCPDADLLNEMVMLNYTYSMLMNREYEFNNFYSLLDESKLAEYQTINALAQKIKELCAKLGCGGISTELADPVKPFNFGNDCGCGCGGNCGCGKGCGCGSSVSTASRTNPPETGCGCNK